MYLIPSVSRRLRTQSIYDRKGAREGVLEVWSSREVHHCIGRKGERTVRYVRFDSKSGNLPTCLPRWCITWYSWHLWCNILFVTTTESADSVQRSKCYRAQMITPFTLTSSDWPISWLCLHLLRISGGRTGCQGWDVRSGNVEFFKNDKFTLHCYFLQFYEIFIFPSGNWRTPDPSRLFHHQESPHSHPGRLHGQAYLVSWSITSLIEAY